MFSMNELNHLLMFSTIFSCFVLSFHVLDYLHGKTFSNFLKRYLFKVNGQIATSAALV